MTYVIQIFNMELRTVVTDSNFGRDDLSDFKTLSKKSFLKRVCAKNLLSQKIIGKRVEKKKKSS